MKAGKISESVLKRSVLKHCKIKHPGVLQGAGLGRDCQLVSTDKKMVVSCSVHPTAIDSLLKVRFSLEHAVNNLACSGSLPVSVMLVLLLPMETEERTIKEIMAEAETVCGELGIQIAGGHTEMTQAVSQPVLSVTALGMLDDEPLSVDRVRPGMDVLVAGTVAREGTGLLLAANEKKLKKYFPLDFVEEARKIGQDISILPLALCAKEFGAVALHDASIGGIFGALWELCEGAKAGLEAQMRKIPIRQETIEICEYFGKNPYCLLSGGALLIVTADGENMEQRLRRQGFAASVIGKVTSGNDRILRNGEEKRYLDRPVQDEIYRTCENSDGQPF